MGFFKKIGRGLKKVGKRINIGKAALAIGGLVGAPFTGGASLAITGKSLKGLIKKKPRFLGGIQKVEFQGIGGLNRGTQNPYSYSYNSSSGLSFNSGTNDNQRNNRNKIPEGSTQITTIAAAVGVAKLLNLF